MSHLVRVLAAASAAALLSVSVPPGTQAAATAAAKAPASAPKLQPRQSLTAFKSDAELRAWLKRHAPRPAPRYEAYAQAMEVPASPNVAMPSVAMAAPPPPADMAAKESVAADAAGASNLSNATGITNTQHAGVDEGGIVKVAGDHLLILRRGRLFTVRVGDRDLKPVSTVNAYGPGVNGSGAWYDELLIWQDKVVVIGYSYERGGTEVGLFKLSRDGKLKYLSTHQLRSNDYYSSRNYASRLLDGKLVLYAPVPLYPQGRFDDMLPAVRHWGTPAQPGAFKRLVPATRIYAPGVDLPQGDWGYPELVAHTVTTCDLADDGFDCEASAVVGAPGRVFYVSPRAVYVWVDGGPEMAMLYRLPLTGEAPQALRVKGAPVDNYSFREDANGWLNVLVSRDGSGDAMWDGEGTRGDSPWRLLRVPVSAFGAATAKAPRSAWHRLPSLPGGGYEVQNRYVGQRLLFGASVANENATGRRGRMKGAVVVADLNAPEDAEVVTLPHGLTRIEQMGRDAVLVGPKGSDLVFTALKLGDETKLGQRYQLEDAGEGETRSHGFFYRPDDAESGVFALPVREAGQGRYASLGEGSASVLFVRNDGEAFTGLGELEATQLRRSIDDGCVASCADWYGNARPIFLGQRTFALLGYEIVEGRITAGGISEVRRVDLTPRGARDTRTSQTE